MAGITDAMDIGSRAASAAMNLRKRPRSPIVKVERGDNAGVSDFILTLTRRSPKDFLQLSWVRIRCTDLKTGVTVNKIVEGGEFETSGPLSHAGVMDAGTGRTIYSYAYDEPSDQWRIFLSNVLMHELGNGRTSTLIKVFINLDGKVIGHMIVWDAESARQHLVKRWNVAIRIGLWFRSRKWTPRVG